MRDPGEKTLTRRQAVMALTPAPALLTACGSAPPKPNILWITCEDMSPMLGCYGDKYAATPNLDRLAAEGVRFNNAYVTAPVCSPVRSCLITGVQANSMGSMNLRGFVPRSRSVPTYPELLRQAGYYTSNNEKEDYNFESRGLIWDESSGKAHWRNRAKGQPFFSVFNLMATHQGRIRYSREEFEKINAGLPEALRHDPARVPLPPYYPDTPDVRLQVAIMYTQVTLMDRQVGEILRQLQDDGLAEDTIVFFYSDHGTGLPRGKRFLHDSGIHIPLIIRFPKKYRRWQPGSSGSATDRIVSTIDFPPTLLSLAGIQASKSMQGSAFLGPHAGPPRQRIFAARDRVDEEIEVSRTVLEGRYEYIRNYYPHRPVMQHGTYSEVGYVWKELRRLDAEGALSGPTRWLMRETKPPEELYDLRQDPNEMRNLISDPEHAGVLERLRRQLRDWMVEIHDTGLLPEPDMLSRSHGEPPYDMARDPERFPVRRILDAAEMVGRPEHLPRIQKVLTDADDAVRYWAVITLINLEGRDPSRLPLLKARLADSSPAVRIAAGEAVCRQGAVAEGVPALRQALGSSDACVQLMAVNAIWHLGQAVAKAAAPALKAALATKTKPDEQRTFFEWATQKTLARWKL